jgi:protein arginine N-methyltransferase 1
LDPDSFTQSNHPAFHYQSMLADRVRMQRYRRAIAATVRPGDVVADLGTGTGVLAIMACQTGAARVYAVDHRPRSLWVADRLVRANGVQDRVRLVEGDAREVQLDEPVDVIVNELIGDFGTDERIAECVGAFARRHLAPAGRVLPSRLRTRLVPVEYRGEFRGVWSEGFHGLDLRAGNAFPCREDAVMYALRERPRELAEAAVVEDIHFGGDMAERATERAVHFAIAQAGMLQGFVGSFEATLAAGIEIDNYPCYPGCHWQNWHWPVSPPRALDPGREIRGRLRMPLGGVALGWKLTWELV